MLPTWSTMPNAWPQIESDHPSVPLPGVSFCCAERHGSLSFCTTVVMLLRRIGMDEMLVRSSGCGLRPFLVL